MQVDPPDAGHPPPPAASRRAAPHGAAAARPAATPAQDASPLTESHHAYWRKNLRLTAALLAIWFLVTFGVAFCARELSFSFFGWPFSFWVASQGALIVYLLIIWYYARAMDRLDRAHGVAEDEER